MDKDSSVRIAKRFTGTPIESLRDLWDRCQRYTLPDGAIVECGVLNGGTAVLVWAAFGGKRDLWMFDSWQGVPEPDSNDPGRAHSLWEHHEIAHGGWCKGQISLARQATREIGCPEERAHLVEGWVADTLPHFGPLIGPIAFLHLDVDIYRSYMDCLVNLWQFVAPGGVVFFNDYGYWTGCDKAVTEFAQIAPDFCLDDLDITPPCGAWIVKR